MKKLQQFYIMKFESDRLDYFGYHIKRVIGGTRNDPHDLRATQELIALGDNQALRIIREIRYERNPNIIQYDAEKLKNLQSRKRWLKKQEFTKEVKKEVGKINTMIDDMLFMPEYVSVVINDDKHYKTILTEGLYINNFRYNRLMCSAGQARVNTVILIREDFEEEVKRRLKCGAKEVKITKNKYNAYFALSSSSTHLTSKPNCLLVDDCEIEMTKHVDWISKIPKEEKTKLTNNERVTEEDKTLTFNLFDGCGAISVEFAKQVAEELQLSYLPSAFCIRCAYVKGMVFVVDFKEYAREHNKEYVIDLYGNPQRIEDIDIILTKSQFKLWNAYDSMEDYNRLCDDFHFSWGVTKLSPKKDDNSFRTNYQFLQAIDLTRQEDIEEICHPTIDWIKGIVGENINYALLFLLGGLIRNPDNDLTNILNMTNDNVGRALLLDHDMINEEYIRSTLMQSLNKKIRESYLGKLVLNGNFSVMIPDMYAFLQHTFGDEVTGAMKEHEYYSHFWNERNVDTVVGMRSPLTWRSEVNKLNLVQNKLTDKWFKYLTSGIVYNVWGCDCIIHADSDFDGDLVCTCNHPVFLRCRYDNLPITYEKLTVEKEYIKEEELYQADIKSFNSTIGQITNISTSFYELLAKFEGKPEYAAQEKEIIERLKLIRKAQGDAIDKAKGIKIEKMPGFWTHRTKNVPKGETQEKVDFVNSIVADRKPYFMRYLYPQVNMDYKKYLENCNRYTTTKFAKRLEELLSQDKDTLTEEEADYIENSYNKYNPLMDYNGRMNRVCHYMENELKELYVSKKKTPTPLLEKMCGNPNRAFSDEHVKAMGEYYKAFKDAKQKRRREKMIDGISSSNYFSLFVDNLRDEIINRFDGNLSYVTDLAIFVCYTQFPSRAKDFCWDLFGEQILEHLRMHNGNTVQIPVPDDEGDLEYLWGKYKVVEVELKEEGKENDVKIA